MKIKAMAAFMSTTLIVSTVLPAGGRAQVQADTTDPMSEEESHELLENVMEMEGNEVGTFSDDEDLVYEVDEGDQLVKYEENISIEDEQETITTKRYVKEKEEDEYTFESETQMIIHLDENGDFVRTEHIDEDGNEAVVEEEEMTDEPIATQATYTSWTEGSRVLNDSQNVKYRTGTGSTSNGQAFSNGSTKTIDNGRELFIYFRGHVDKMRSAEADVGTAGMATLFAEIAAASKNGGMTVAKAGRLALKVLGRTLGVGTVYNVYLFGHHYNVAVRQYDAIGT